MPVDMEQAETLRNPRSGFVAYVPPGSIEKGRDLVTTGGMRIVGNQIVQGKTTPCVTCHGLDLMGVADVPPIAGRSPSYLVAADLGHSTGSAKRRSGSVDEAGDRESRRRRSRLGRGICVVARSAAERWSANARVELAGCKRSCRFQPDRIGRAPTRESALSRVAAGTSVHEHGRLQTRSASRIGCAADWSGQNRPGYELLHHQPPARAAPLR